MRAEHTTRYRDRIHVFGRSIVCCLLFCTMLIAGDAPKTNPVYDVVVYGGTSGAVMAAVQVARMGKSVLLVSPDKHLGGLSSGGLGATDIGNKSAIGGLSREFYKRLGTHYAQDSAWKWQTASEYRSGRQQSGEGEMWTFEPHVAEQLFEEFLSEAKVPVERSARLELDGGVGMRDGRIQSITTESGKVFQGRIFIDATYEGDLMAKAGVSYHVGREANATYKETLNGVQTKRAIHHQFKVPVDPYVVSGDPKSGLLPGIQEEGPGEEGAGDHRVQAYNFRMCLTDKSENRLPFPKPKGYDPLRYELLLRYIEGGVFDAFGSNSLMPNRKTDTNNNGGFSTDNIGMNYAYPDADYATREMIFQDHVTYQQGMMWFLVNDPRVPEKIRSQMGRWGLCGDEFQESGGWPHQMYVREARRMVSDFVMTQHHCQGREVAENPVGLAAYTMDSHNTQRYVKDGKAINEGDVQVGGFPPYPIGYGSIVPKQSECQNLFVPVCLSASHMAYGSIRMEPVFMVLGQSAATAAVHAIEEKVAVQKIDMPRLHERLLADKQVLAWTGPRPNQGFDPKKMKGIVQDDTDAALKGEWLASVSVAGFVGPHYLHDNNEGKGMKEAVFTLKVPEPGGYEVRIYYSANANRATNVPVIVTTAAEPFLTKLNQRAAAKEGYKSLGVLNFKDQAIVKISNFEADGHVIIDAVQLIPVGEKPE